jgi:hypothetical protein
MRYSEARQILAEAALLELGLLDEDYTTPGRDLENRRAINTAFARRQNADRELMRDDRERASPNLIGKGGKKVKLRKGVAYRNINVAGQETKRVLKPKN